MRVDVENWKQIRNETVELDLIPESIRTSALSILENIADPEKLSMQISFTENGIAVFGLTILAPQRIPREFRRL